jgi:hypothetical protein
VHRPGAYTVLVRAFDLRLSLANVIPPVWRVLRVPRDLRLDDLHHAIQAVFGWDDFHPHVFEVGERDYGPEPVDDEDDEEGDAWRETSDWAGEDRDLTVADALQQSPDGFGYVYDFGEDWRVDVTLVAASELDDPTSVVCIGGEHAGPQQESRELDPFTVDAANARLRKARRPRATPEHPAGPGASADQQLLANLTLVVLLLGSHRATGGTRESWKNVRGEILDSLTEAGLVDSDPRSRSVLITDAGVAHAERLLKRLRAL